MAVTLRLLSPGRLDRVRLRRLARAVMAAEGVQSKAELNVTIGDDVWMQELNQRYKGKARPTDVLAFPQGTAPAEEGPLLGDIAISVETAERQARELGHSLMEEIEILLTHGILHLTGWDDDTASRRRRMMGRALDLVQRSHEADAH